VLTAAVFLQLPAVFFVTQQCHTCAGAQQEQEWQQCSFVLGQHSSWLAAVCLLSFAVSNEDSMSVRKPGQHTVCLSGWLCLSCVFGLRLLQGACLSLCVCFELVCMS
jgi:hypothetical protein